MRDEGHAYTRIAKVIGCAKGTVRGWCDDKARQKNIELNKARRKARKGTLEYWACYTHKAARDRAAKKGCPFDLNREDIKRQYPPDNKCPVFGIELTFKGNRGDNAASLDRIIPDLGYVRGNIAVISNRANSVKSNGTAEEHRKVADWIESKGANDAHTTRHGRSTCGFPLASMPHPQATLGVRGPLGLLRVLGSHG